MADPLSGNHAPKPDCSAFEDGTVQAYAENRNSNALYLLGEGSRIGVCLERDLAQAFDYLHRSATLGNLDAVFSLSLVFADERYAGFDEQEANKLLRVAADAEHPAAQHRLGLLLAASAEDDAQRGEAEALLSAAARKGRAHAAASLGMIYEKGMHGFPERPCKAFYWYGVAHGQGFEEAGNGLERIQSTTQGRCALMN